MRRPEARRLLEPGRDLQEDDPFWENVWDGLAVFLSPSLFRRYTIARALRESLDVGERFHLRPLLPALDEEGRFFVLTLSQQRVALLEGTAESLIEVSVPGLPQDLASALHFESFPPEREIQFRNLIWHGQTEGTEDLTRYLRDFVQVVDHAVAPVLRGERAPLILVAVEYLHPLYAEANSYPHLFDDGIRGNPRSFSVEELHRRATASAGAAAERRIDRVLADYAEQGGGPRSSEELSAVLVGAFFGRIARLFIADDAELWGRFDPLSLEVRVHDRKQKGDVDLIDEAAMRVLSTDGEVVPVTRDRIPGHGPLAALFRY